MKLLGPATGVAADEGEAWERVDVAELGGGAKRKIVLKLAQCALLWLLLIRVHFPQKFLLDISVNDGLLQVQHRFYYLSKQSSNDCEKEKKKTRGTLQPSCCNGDERRTTKSAILFRENSATVHLYKISCGRSTVLLMMIFVLVSERRKHTNRYVHRFDSGKISEHNGSCRSCSYH